MVRTLSEPDQAKEQLTSLLGCIKTCSCPLRRRNPWWVLQPSQAVKPEVQLSLQLGCNQIKSYLLCVFQPSSKPCMCQNVQTTEQLPSDPGRIQSCSHPARISCQIIKSRLLLEFRCRFCTKTIASGCRFLSMSKGCYGFCSEHLHSRFQFVHLVLHPRLWKRKRCQAGQASVARAC